MSLEEILLTFTYLAILVLMTTNGAVSFPSSQILYIIAGYFVSTGDLNLSLVLLIGALGNTIGNIILYEVVRYKGLEYVVKWKLFHKETILKVQYVFEKYGAPFLFVGKLLPALKVVVPICAGVMKMKRYIYIPIIFVSSFLWACVFVALGYFFGKGTDIYGTYVPVLIVIAVVVAVVFYKLMNSKDILERVSKEEKKSK